MTKTELRRFFRHASALLILLILCGPVTAATKSGTAARKAPATATKSGTKAAKPGTTPRKSGATATKARPTARKSGSTATRTNRARKSAPAVKKARPAPPPAPTAVPRAGIGSTLEVTGDFAAAIVLDVNTGTILAARHEHERRQPASMLKMMTELVILEQVDRGQLTLDDVVTVSPNASRVGGSQVYLKPGEQFTVRELLMALAIHSANDAATALAEHAAGSTAAFVALMNGKARELHMTNTDFHSVHGLPPARGQLPDISTAYDMTLLARELIKHPESLEWGGTASAPFRDGTFTLHNPNKLIGRFEGLDGLKTGYTRPAGFCVTATARRNQQRLLSVVMGCSTNNARASETSRLLTMTFDLFEPVQVIDNPGMPLPQMLSVRGGKVREVPVTCANELVVNVPRGKRGELVIEREIPRQASAPLAAGAEVGRVLVKLGDRLLGSAPIITLQEAPRGSWFHRLVR